MRRSICALEQTQAAAAAPAIDASCLDEKHELIGPRSVRATPDVQTSNYFSMETRMLLVMA